MSEHVQMQQGPVMGDHATETEYEIDLMEMLYRLLVSWKLIICLVLVFAIAFGAYSMFLATPMYEAKSTIYVISRSDSAINMADIQIGSALTQDYIKIFKIWEVHDKVITELNLPYTYAEIQEMLTVTNDSNTRMLDIKVSSNNPTEAANIANAYATIASEYIAETMVTDKPTIVSSALTPVNPVSPNKTKNVILGGLLGGVLACVIVIIRMLLDDKYRTVEDIRKYTGLTTLAVIPIEPTDEKNLKNKNKKKARKQA